MLLSCVLVVALHMTCINDWILNKWLNLLEIGIVDYLNTEISTSKQKKFSLVTFVDTPGLVDGDMKYPFDVNKAILWLGRNILY